MENDLLSDIEYWPLSTSQEDLNCRLTDLMAMIKRPVEGTNAKFAEAIVDVITYQS